MTEATLAFSSPDQILHLFGTQDRYLRQVRDEAERKAVITVLSRANGNVVSAAELLGVTRPTLYNLISRYGLKQSVSLKTDEE